ASRRVSVAPNAPQDGPQDPSAIHGEARDQVEEAKAQVDDREPAQERAELWLRHAQVDQEQEPANQQAADRSRGSDQRLVARLLWLALHLSRATEDEQGDRGGAHAKAAGYQRVRQLVREHGRKEEDRRDRPDQPIELCPPSRGLGWKLDLRQGV